MANSDQVKKACFTLAYQAGISVEDATKELCGMLLQSRANAAQAGASGGTVPHFEDDLADCLATLIDEHNETR